MVDDFPPHLRRAWRRRVHQLTRGGATGEQLAAAEVRALYELSPEGSPWRHVVAEWPADRRERYASLVEELADFGLAHHDCERRAYLAVVAEGDGPEIPRLDPAELAQAD